MKDDNFTIFNDLVTIFPNFSSCYKYYFDAIFWSLLDLCVGYKILNHEAK